MQSKGDGENMSYGRRVIDSFGKPSQLNFGVWVDQTDFKPEVQELCKSHKAKAGIQQGPTRSGKVIVIGAQKVGKTSLILRYCQDIFKRNYKTTIGIDFEVEKYQILEVPFNMQIWDTSGQERFRAIIPAYFKGAVVVVLAFDLASDESLCKTGEWLKEMKEICQSNFDVFLVACKSDLLSDSLYKEKEKLVTHFAEQCGAEYWCTSSRTGENVDLLFTRVATVAFENVLMREIEASTIPWLVPNSPLIRVRPEMAAKKKMACCSSCMHSRT